MVGEKKPQHLAKGRKKQPGERAKIKGVLELNASLPAFSGIVLGRFVNRNWL